ncbi:MAG: copper amine oxidase N-terminal domain-containing protein [Candidatus Eremiobacteraeota bacterium]|nr:copper amine oxidase N-terminal domain-containing protein [Candidatus Eremiobacteraeota bacterium]MBV9700564.1 copper amine oxidase N-terminal domain-containing protein [Candidatus Eremiobacteraeota bacterium]
MKRLSTGVLALLMTVGVGFTAVAAHPGGSHGNIGTNAVAQDQGPASPPPANFGSPPSGQIPILYNDHHVYTKPDILKQGRVLAALVRGGTLLIPLRSMFEQMGATVSYDAGSKTATVSKAGAEVKVTVGKPEVVINGETRPLDVPPVIYQGTVLVPVRVISEGMGAYVQWVPDRHLVVVRYIPATPPPPPAPPPPSAMPPPPPPPPPPPAPYYDFYVAGDYIFSPKVYNEFVPGNTSTNNNGGFSYRLHGAIEIPIMALPFMVEVDYRQWNWQHNCAGKNDPECYVTTIGGLGQYFQPAFIGRDYDFDARLGLRILKPRIYLVGGYMWRGNNYGYPKETGAGVGLEKLPDLDRVFSWYGSALYYFGINGNYTSTPLACGNPTGSSCTYNVGYNMLKYDIGVSYTFPGFPLFIEVGFLGDRGWAYNAAPIGISEYGPYAGIGLKI